MRGQEVLRRARPGVGPSSQAPLSALAQRAQKVIAGDCAGIAGDGLHQQARRAVFGVLHKVNGRGVVGGTKRPPVMGPPGHRKWASDSPPSASKDR
jgi:hypothetical protein